MEPETKKKRYSRFDAERTVDSAGDTYSRFDAERTVIRPEDFSTLNKLKRITAYCLRFIFNLRQKHKKEVGPLQPHELTAALQYFITKSQQQHFPEEYNALKTGKQLKQNSHLVSLQPFMDDKGLIRVGGRLRNAAVSDTQKHPILLPATSHLSELIARHHHLQQLHAGPQLLLASLRQQFWPLRGRNLARKIVHKCVTCFKTNPRTSQQQMGDLPTQRTMPSRPFTNTGVDFCGPTLLKTSNRKNSPKAKCYIAVFVCFSTKAIHLELVSGLTTDAFIASLKRFIARRGICSNIYCDNGTNFVGAERELKELRELFRKEQTQQRISQYSADESIKWHFIPPRSPHFGGLWEAGVKSVKHHLKRVVGNASLTFEHMYTVLTMVEACLNSRPLTPLSNDPNDLNPLTPGHFLIGQALTAVPEPSLIHIQYNRLSHWQRSQQLLQHFWSRWSKEYLSTLQQRKKWSANVPNISPGQLVVIKEDNLPPMKWAMARVEEVHPGADGRARVATVRTATSTLRRATNRLCVLPLE